MALSLRVFFVHRYYKRLFRAKDHVFGEAAKMVLGDLQDFCFASRSTLEGAVGPNGVDAIAQAHHEGRRHVFMRIQQMVGISNEEAAEFERQMRSSMRPNAQPVDDGDD